MEVKEVDPFKIRTSDLNERQENVMTEDSEDNLRGSVESVGVLEPPAVRETNDDSFYDYEAIFGQRRVYAAQAADLDTIPVQIVDWDDSQSLMASITENIESFRKEVSRKDRARAIKTLKEMNGWKDSELAENLGISQSTVERWKEFNMDGWEGTEVHVSSSSNRFSEVSPDIIQTARRMGESPKEAEEILSRFTDEDLSREEVREVREMVKNGSDVDTSIDIVTQKVDGEGLTVKVHLDEEESRIINRMAEDENRSANEVAHDLINRGLQKVVSA